MKKILFVAVLALASITAYAQPRAVGVNVGLGSSISYEHGFGPNNMLDVAANVILPFTSGFGVGGHVTYDWIDPFNAVVPWEEQGEWHWYMGVGGAGGFMFAGNDLAGNAHNSRWYAGVAGHIGIEYDFWFPFQLSLDWRPDICFGMEGSQPVFHGLGLLGGIQLGIRYKF